MFSSYFPHNCLLLPCAKGKATRSTIDLCRGEEAMNVKKMCETGLGVLADGMRSLVTGKSLTQLQGPVGKRAGVFQRFEKRVLRRFFGEELLVFAAVASAYLLAYAAAMVFKQ
jgi:hypothetical protein